MKLSLRDLESARVDPAGFVQRTDAAAPTYRRFSKSRVLQLAALQFHRQHENLGAAQNYLEDQYRTHFKGMAELPKLQEQLERYAAGFVASGNTVCSMLTRVSIEVEPELELTGEIPRFDLAENDGYAAWLFTKTLSRWRGELRMPLLQRHFADQMGVGVEQVSVGFYSFQEGLYDSERYSARRVAAALRECQSLAGLLRPPAP